MAGAEAAGGKDARRIADQIDAAEQGARLIRKPVRACGIVQVDRDDMRLVGDIERLIKTKIELEPYELVDDRPRRAPYRERERERFDERPAQADDAEPARPVERAAREPAPERAPREFDRPRRSMQPPADPFFEKPYEPPAAGADKPAWELKGAAAAAAAPVRGLSPNIRSKRKVASLLGGGSKA